MPPARGWAQSSAREIGSLIERRRRVACADKRRALVRAAFGLILLLGSTANAAGLDVDAWLKRPGVRLLAVEFYATWCKPCMAAVPRWKALHEKYRKDGLRLVVVSTQDPSGICANPGWAPDETVCDLDGAIAQSFGANELPAAFLWGWQGHQLVAKGHVEDVEAAIQSWMREAPRVEVSVDAVPNDVMLSPDLLRGYVVDEIGQSGKLIVVAGDAEREQLAALKQKQFGPRFDESLRCDVGRELPANSLLKVSVLGDSARPRLALQLHSAETGCLSASALADLDSDHPDRAVAEALATLMAKTRTETQLPGRARPPVSPKPSAPRPSYNIEEAREHWSPQATDEVLVHFASAPDGAVVIVDGELLCQNTPCSKSLARGPHSVTMQKERYEKRSDRVTAEPNLKVEWKLDAAFGTISIASEPPGIETFVNRKRVGTTPIARFEVDPGEHEVWIESPCFQKKGERIVVDKGESRKLAYSAEPRESAIEVKAQAEDGNDVEAVVLVDGAQIGTTPGTFKVSTCAKRLDLRTADGEFTDTLSLEERKVSHIKAVLRSKRGRSEPGRGRPDVETASGSENGPSLDQGLGTSPGMPPPESVVAPASRSRAAFPVAFWVSLGLGLATAGTATGLFVAANGTKSELDSLPAGDTRARDLVSAGETQQAVAALLSVVSVVALVAATAVMP